MLRLVLAVLVLGFTIYTLVDCVQTPDDQVRGLPKILWVAVILLFPLAGGTAWYMGGRPTLPSLPQGRRPQGPRGPDDDPEFLRRL
ncbi:MAG: PLD nuclease N-terminal domain-containing protein [Micrococcales bacterium]|nr:PLD nuclease N-terminal domain-containing protein [Micrococcales bacterium]